MKKLLSILIILFFFSSLSYGMFPTLPTQGGINSSTPSAGVSNKKNAISFESNLDYGGASSSVTLLRTIMTAAMGSPARAKRFVVDGDSQETSPTGLGTAWLTLLNYNLYLTYGNIPESQIMANTAYGGGSPYAAVGSRGTRNGGVFAGSAATNRFPYSMEPSGNNRYTSVASVGTAVVLQANLLTVPSDLTEISRTVEYIPRSGLVFHMLVPYLADQGDTLKVISSISSDGANHYFDPYQETTTKSITAAQVASNNWLQVDYTYNYGGTDPTSGNILTVYPQVLITSNNVNQVEVGPHWFSSGTTKGIIVSMISMGGVNTTEQFIDRPNMLPFLLAYDPNVIMLSCGANDVVDNISAATFKTNVQTKINTYLAANPNLVFILLSDPDRTGLTAGQGTEFDQYGTKLRELALIPANRAVFIDRKRILFNKYGWDRNNASNMAVYLVDGVHYSTAGARLVAREDARAILDLGL